MIFLLAVATTGFVLFFFGKKWQIYPCRDNQLSINDEIKLKSLLSKLKEEYIVDCQQLRRNYNQRFRKQLANEFSAARKEIPNAVNNICGILNSSQLCFLLLKDKFTRKNEFPAACREIINKPFLIPLKNTLSLKRKLLNNLHWELQERINQLQADLATVLPAVCLQHKIEEPNIVNQINNLHVSIESNTLNSFIATASLGIEAVFIRRTINDLSQLFAKPVARLTASLGISGGVAIADGPLPFGDIAGGIISGGGLIWSGIDITYVTAVLPPELTKKWLIALNSCEEEIWKNFNNTSKKLTDEAISKAMVKQFGK